MSPKDEQRTVRAVDEEWSFPFEAELHASVPGVHDAQNAWLAQIDSLQAPDRKTHELIRMVCMVIQRNAAGTELHARLAAEVGASWEEVIGSIMLTEPAFGLLGATEALSPARRGWERGRRSTGGAPAKPAHGATQGNTKPAKAAKKATKKSPKH